MPLTARSQSTWTVTEGDTLRCIPLPQFREVVEIMAEHAYATRALDSVQAESARRMEAIEAQSRQIGRLQSVVILDSLRIESYQRTVELSEDRWRNERGNRWKWGIGGALAGLAAGAFVVAVFGP